MLISALITFLVVILILYLINLLPLDGRAKQIARIVVIILGIDFIAEIHRGILAVLDCFIAEPVIGRIRAIPWLLATTKMAPHNDDKLCRKKSPGDAGAFRSAVAQIYLSVANQSSTSLWI